MNLTTQQFIQRFYQESPSQLPSFSQIIRLTCLTILKAVQKILLTYPLNVIVLFALLYWLIYRIISSFKKPKIMVYSPNQHYDRHDQHIKNFKKDIREIQNESLALSRKMESKVQTTATQNQADEKMQNKKQELEKDETLNDLKSLIEERQYIKQVSKDFFRQIKTSQAQILDKLKKYRR